MTNWSGKVPDIAEREEAARLLDEWRSLSDTEGENAPDVVAAMEAAKAVRDLKFQEADDEYWATLRALDGGHGQRTEDARRAYEGHPLTCAEDSFGNPVRCALTGIPILTEDRTVSVDDTDHLILAVVLDIPEHLFEDEDDEGQEEVAA